MKKQIGFNAINPDPSPLESFYGFEFFSPLINNTLGKCEVCKYFVSQKRVCEGGGINPVMCGPLFSPMGALDNDAKQESYSHNGDGRPEDVGNSEDKGEIYDMETKVGEYHFGNKPTTDLPIQRSANKEDLEHMKKAIDTLKEVQMPDCIDLSNFESIKKSIVAFVDPRNREGLDKGHQLSIWNSLNLAASGYGLVLTDEINNCVNRFYGEPLSSDNMSLRIMKECYKDSEEKYQASNDDKINATLMKYASNENTTQEQWQKFLVYAKDEGVNIDFSYLKKSGLCVSTINKVLGNMSSSILRKSKQTNDRNKAVMGFLNKEIEKAKFLFKGFDTDYIAARVENVIGVGIEKFPNIRKAIEDMSIDHEFIKAKLEQK